MMMYESDVLHLVDQWKERMQEAKEDDLHSPYWVALDECITELENLVNTNRDLEAQAMEYYDKLSPAEVEEFLKENEADYWISSMEGQELNYL